MRLLPSGGHCDGNCHTPCVDLMKWRGLMFLACVPARKDPNTPGGSCGLTGVEACLALCDPHPPLLCVWPYLLQAVLTFIITCVCSEENSPLCPSVPRPLLGALCVCGVVHLSQTYVWRLNSVVWRAVLGKTDGRMWCLPFLYWCVITLWKNTNLTFPYLLVPLIGEAVTCDIIQYYIGRGEGRRKR